jgi:hypothetical protein
MASWAAFDEAAPELARFGYECLTALGDLIGFFATIRADDGGPRVHPVCPILGEGRLFVAIPRTSPKNADLRADGRFMLHAFPTDEDREFSIRGRARLVDDDGRAVAAAAAGHATGVRESEDVFELEIERADSTTWRDWNTPSTRPIRRRWIAR